MNAKPIDEIIAEATIEIWSGTDDKGITAKCIYHSIPNLLEVIVSKDSHKYSEVFPCMFVPTFGLDVQDHDTSCMIAEKLAQKIESELKI